MLVVEQDARIALATAARAYVLEVGAGRGRGVERRAPGQRFGATELPGLLDSWMPFCQQVVSGLASGGIFGALALALVLIHRATGVINFAQGEMATFTTYILWTLTTNHGWPYWPAFAFTLLFAFVGGFAHPPGRDPTGRAEIGSSRS